MLLSSECFSVYSEQWNFWACGLIEKALICLTFMGRDSPIEHLSFDWSLQLLVFPSLTSEKNSYGSKSFHYRWGEMNNTIGYKKVQWSTARFLYSEMKWEREEEGNIESPCLPLTGYLLHAATKHWIYR